MSNRKKERTTSYADALVAIPCGPRIAKATRIFLITFSPLLLGVSPSAEAQVAESTAVVGIVESIRNGIEDIIASLEESTGTTLFQARQHLELLISQVEMIAEDSVEAVFSDLTAAERQFFNDLQNQIDTLREMERITVADAQRLSDSVSSAVRALPFASTHPVVLSYRPLFVISGGATNDDFLQVEFSGALLASHEPTLVVGNATCERSRKIDTQLAFMCNKNLFLAEQTVEPLAGTLTVYEDVKWWLFWEDPTEHQYDISINVIPAVLGQATLSVTTELKNEIRENREQSFNHRNAFCSGVRRPLFQFNARQDWKIDPGSIESSCQRSSRSSCHGLRGVTESSFGYSCTVQNRGQCLLGFRDARGSCWGKVTWEEVQEEVELAEETLDTRVLHWGADESIALPEGTKAVRLIVEKVDGTRRVVTDTESRDPWFDVVVDLQRRHVVISVSQKTPVPGGDLRQFVAS